MSCLYPLFTLIIHSKGKNSLSPRDFFFPVSDCVHGNSFAPYLGNGPHFSTSLSASSTGRLEGGVRGWQRLSEVTSLINKLVQHTCVRRAICSQFVLCSGATEHSHNLLFVYSGVQPLSHAGKAENQKQETE